MTPNPATWHSLADQLTPQQVAFMQRCDGTAKHPNGPEAHRRGMIQMALLYSTEGPGGLN